MPWYRSLIVVATFAAVLLAGLPAVADRPTNGEVHCVVEVIDRNAAGELVVSAPVCYATFEEAIMAPSVGSMTNEMAPSGEEFFADQTTGVVVASFTLGIHFDGSNGTGSSISVVGSSCTGGYWNTGASWANRISSSSNGCYRLRHHDGPNKTGTYADTVGSGIHNLPSYMNNKTESVSYLGS